MSTWPTDLPGVVQLPSGRRVRGRALRSSSTDGPAPDHVVVLSRRRPAGGDVSLVRWVRWRDFGVPRDPDDARDALVEAWRRTEHERVEVGCRGGRGRTGTALACLAVLDGLSPEEAVRFVRERYHRRAVETPGQRRFLHGFAAGSV